MARRERYKTERSYTHPKARMKRSPFVLTIYMGITPLICAISPGKLLLFDQLQNDKKKDKNALR